MDKERILKMIDSHEKGLKRIHNLMEMFYRKDKNCRNGVDLIDLELQQAYEVGSINVLTIIRDWN